MGGIGVKGEVRARSEPLAVDVVLGNPLGLVIELAEVQIVASLVAGSGVGVVGAVHTNECPASQGEDVNDNKTWKFHGSEKEYQKPDFLCSRPPPPPSEQPPPTPHFVVTKSALRMEPHSETTLTLNICPMVEGDLKVLGIRFKLLGEVWIYRPFHTPGPLLQNTQLNRSRRVRGESLALKSKVEREMPFLAVSVLRQPTPNNTTTHDNGVVRGGTVLQGQTSSWTLRLSNLGYAPASNITLKTNSPWLNILDSSGAGEEWEEGHHHRNEYASTSYCI